MHGRVRQIVQTCKNIFARVFPPQNTSRTLLATVVSIVLTIIVTVAAINFGNIHNSPLLKSTAVIFTLAIAAVIFCGVLTVATVLFLILASLLVRRVFDIRTGIAKARAEAAAFDRDRAAMNAQIAALNTKIKAERAEQTLLDRARRYIKSNRISANPTGGNQLFLPSGVSMVDAMRAADSMKPKRRSRTGAWVTFALLLCVALGATGISGPVSHHFATPCYVLCGPTKYLPGYIP